MRRPVFPFMARVFVKKGVGVKIPSLIGVYVYLRRCIADCVNVC